MIAPSQFPRGQRINWHRDHRPVFALEFVAARHQLLYHGLLSYTHTTAITLLSSMRGECVHYARPMICAKCKPSLPCNMLDQRYLPRVVGQSRSRWSDPHRRLSTNLQLGALSDLLIRSQLKTEHTTRVLPCFQPQHLHPSLPLPVKAAHFEGMFYIAPDLCPPPWNHPDTTYPLSIGHLTHERSSTASTQQGIPFTDAGTSNHLQHHPTGCAIYICNQASDVIPTNV